MRGKPFLSGYFAVHMGRDETLFITTIVVELEFRLPNG